MINKVILLGYVGDEPTKNGEGDNVVVSFPLATTERYTKKGEPVEITEWHRIVAFGKVAKFISDYVRKGKQVYIEGSLKTRSFTNSDNVEKVVTEIVVKEVKLCGKKEQ